VLCAQDSARVRRSDPRTLHPSSAVLQQNARTAAAALLPPLTHLPPTMVIPGKKTVEAIAKGEKVGLIGEDREAPVLKGEEAEKAIVGNNVTGDE
jgi:hypothetical protein